MSLEFIDGFDHYNNSTNFLRKWDAGTSTPDNFLAGRYGGNCAQFNGVNAVKTLTAVATRTIGAAVNFSSFSTTSRIFGLLDSGTVQVDVQTISSGQVQVTRNGTVLAVSSVSSPLTTGTWYYIEFQATINSTTGSYTVRITSSGVTSVWLTATNVNTQATGNASTNQVMVGAFTFCNFDDLYVLNSSGSVNNTFLGESRVYTEVPLSDGTNLGWTPSAGTTHCTQVNENPPDDDTTYNISGTAGQIDTYKYPAISPAAVYGVQVTLTERKDDSATRQTAVEYRGGSTNYQGSNTFTLGSSYSMNMQEYDTDPNTGAAWTVANFNAGEFGIKCIA